MVGFVGIFELILLFLLGLFFAGIIFLVVFLSVRAAKKKKCNKQENGN